MNNFTVFLAANADYGVNAKEWITRQASALAIAAMVVILVPIILKKQWALLISTLFAGAVAMYFVNSPETLSGIGKKIYEIVSGG